MTLKMPNCADTNCEYYLFGYSCCCTHTTDIRYCIKNRPSELETLVEAVEEMSKNFRNTGYCGGVGFLIELQYKALQAFKTKYPEWKK